MAKTEVLGIGELGSAFRELKADMEARTARAMVVSAGGVLKRKAKKIAIANGSRRTGAMIKNIAIKREPSAPPGTAQYHLGVRHGNDLSSKQKAASKQLYVNGKGRISVRYVDDPYYWRWVEQGHRIVARADSRAGKNVSRRARRAAATGKVDAKPFIGPALEQGKTEAINAMDARLQRELAKAQKK